MCENIQMYKKQTERIFMVKGKGHYFLKYASLINCPELNGNTCRAWSYKKEPISLA